MSSIKKKIILIMQKNKENYLQKRLKDKKFREGFEKELFSVLISEKLAKIRHEAHLTQEQVARKMHTKKSVISRYESGNYTGFTIGKLLEFAKVCGKRIEFDFVDQGKNRSNFVRRFK